ncbi:hypothetical protein [Pseudarthrobacter sp. NS4]
MSSGAGTTNHGTSTLLDVDNSPEEVAYLKFDLSAYERVDRYAEHQAGR